MKDNRKIYILTTPDLFCDLIRYPFNKGTATDTNMFLLVVGCGVPSIRLDITYWMAACAAVCVSTDPSCGRLPLLLLCGVFGMNCMSGWLADCGLFTIIPPSCMLFWTVAAMVVLHLNSQHLHSSHLVLLGDLRWLNSGNSLVQLSAPLVDLGENYSPPPVSFEQPLLCNLPSSLVAYFLLKDVGNI